MIDPFKIERVIVESLPDCLTLAGKAARWIIERPMQKDAILCYGEGVKEVCFYVKRNKSSISVRQEHSVGSLAPANGPKHD
jgi:hypothetical protein